MLLDHKYTNNVIEKKIDGIFNFERTQGREKWGDANFRISFERSING